MTRFTARTHRTPIGDALLVLADDAAVAVQVVHGSVDDELSRLSRLLGAVPDRDEEPGADVAAQLDEYFAGTRRAFDLALDWRLTRGFTRAALQAVCDIPYGETAGYGEVAIMAGSPRAARAVGTACATTPFSLVVPVHRVVRADGSIGEYGGHPEVKEFLLALERDAGV